jgi:diguanylate cyclase (GGDEF)-like protein
MRSRAKSLNPRQSDPILLNRSSFVQQVLLALVVQIAIAALCARILTPLGRLLPSALTAMNVSFALAALFSSLSLSFSDMERSAKLQEVSRVFALLTAGAAIATFLDPAALVTNQPFFRQDGSHVLTGLALVLISVILVLMLSPGRVANRIADSATFLLCLLVLVLVSDMLFSLAHIPGSSRNGLASSVTLTCLGLLTVAVVLRRAEKGAFCIFLGSGMGGRIARTLTPILLLMPLLRETGRARLIEAHLFPRPYSTAILASVATVVSFALLVLLVSFINKMENEVHELTLRDELTGLYNVRGFNLLAGQSMRLAQRADVPFSVLFIDLDNLKLINDELGHTAGSASLSQTARLLDSTFREADVIARVGGDEFIVAGQFDQEAVAASARRLQELAEARFSDASGKFPLSLSIGYATASEMRSDSLKELVARADAAMYEKKRRKKVAVG